MSSLTRVRGAISIALKVALMAAAMILVAGASQADRGGRWGHGARFARGGHFVGGGHFARGGHFVGGPRFVYGGPRYFHSAGVRVFSAYPRYYRPRTFVTFDFSFGSPYYYYYPPVYHEYIEPYPVVVSPGFCY